ncbi:MAG: polysaccharide lyase family 7 protein, partial [Anaerolineae bacterium]|nr:polysaccharide lyase family 7 protein [Anaerolineae bacterium]
VTLEPSNGKNVIAQVDSMTADILAKIQWDNDRIRVQLRQINADGSTGSYQDYWFAGKSASFPIGTTFDWDMTVENGVLFVTVNGETVTHDFAMLSTTPSVYADDAFYFSAGSQPQDNTEDVPGGDIEAGEVLFYALDVTHDDDGDGVVNSSDNCPAMANSDQADFDGDGAGDVCDLDDDNDGVADTDDAFPFSDTSAIVVIGDCDTGVANQLLASGATFNDLIGEAAADANNRGEFVRAVGQLAHEWRRDDLISGRDGGKIISCAARSGIPHTSVVIGRCDTGVANQTLASGETFNDLIGQAAANATNHHEFVRAVGQLALEWKQDGLIDRRDAGKIAWCAAVSTIP